MSKTKVSVKVRLIAKKCQIANNFISRYFVYFQNKTYFERNVFALWENIRGLVALERKLKAGTKNSFFRFGCNQKSDKIQFTSITKTFEFITVIHFIWTPSLSMNFSVTTVSRVWDDRASVMSGRVRGRPWKDVHCQHVTDTDIESIFKTKIGNI